jgi:nicotinamide-nucleotide amidase
MKNSPQQKATQLGKQLLANSHTVTTAESCTGGGVAEMITSVSGSSVWFDRSFVTYSNESKQEMLGVQEATLDKFGAVSEEVAREMSAGALLLSYADISVSITGVAGPDGGTDDKPVGTIWFAWSTKTDSLEIETQTKKEIFRKNMLLNQQLH